MIQGSYQDSVPPPAKLELSCASRLGNKGHIKELTRIHYVRSPGAMCIAATGSTELAEEVTRASGSEMKLVGINWVYSPVADVNTDPRNPVIGPRSFGDGDTSIHPLSRIPLTDAYRSHEGGRICLCRESRFGRLWHRTNCQALSRTRRYSRRFSPCTPPHPQVPRRIATGGTSALPIPYRRRRRHHYDRSHGTTQNHRLGYSVFPFHGHHCHPSPERLGVQGRYCHRLS